MGQVNKLFPMLRDKKEYVLLYRNLQLYLDLSLKIKKIHRVLEFGQSPWLKQHIDFNTEKREHAKNSFEKEFLQAYEQFSLWEDQGKSVQESRC